MHELVVKRRVQILSSKITGIKSTYSSSQSVVLRCWARGNRWDPGSVSATQLKYSGNHLSGGHTESPVG